MSKIGNLIVIISFIAFIGLISANQHLKLFVDKEYNENKKKAEKPPFNIMHLDAFPGAYENYYSDHFSLRGSFVSYMGALNVKLWRKSPKPNKVILGKDNWLYNVDKELDNYYGKRKFITEELAKVVQEFSFRKGILDSMGIKMLVVINPTKFSIYPEYLPNILKLNNTNTSGNQLENALLENKIPVLYTKDLLIDLKEQHQLFYKGDNHWNDIAGYYVARDIVKKIDMEIPEIPFSSFALDTIAEFKGNLAHMTGVAKQYSERSIKLKAKIDDAEVFVRFKHLPKDNVGYKDEFQVSYKSSNNKLPNALFIRDSFAKALIPYLKNSFHYSTFIWDGWNYGFNLEIIEEEKPDVVIYMVLESIIPNIYTKGLSN